jgi:GTP diphosphokinase / guanosine-3',5'-bis(diphosphate) 3'-diphosphatase
MGEVIYTIEDLEKLIKKNYTNPDCALVREAYELALKSHAGILRKTGQPYIIHPLAVAYKLASMRLHINVVVAGILHDIVEDTGIEIEDIQQRFGADIASLVDSVTKLKKIRYQGEDRFVENMRKMFLAMAQDVRVVFMKFADRLHNLSTLYAMPKKKQQRTATESLEIYAPIAGRLGMSEMKGELEDGAFAYLNPKEYERMRSIMDAKVREKGAHVSRIIETINSTLTKAEIVDFETHGRLKRLYSLHKKLKRYDGDLSRIYDLIAIRIIVNDVEECYATLGLLHQMWRPVPGRIKDYIAQPKPNGYQSLHTTVFTEDREIVEFQIRTKEMHEIAEYGIAAHWRYKETKMRPGRETQWMEELIHIQKELANKKDFLEQLEHMKVDVFKDRIFVFTPKGDVLDLPEGATPIDFAYFIHTDIGNKASAALINDAIANLDSQLKSGDVVEILTDKNRRGPNPDWMKTCKTRHARQKIRDATKNTVKGWIANVMSGREKAKRK